MSKKFGGDWTERKLDAIESYLKAYLTALSNQRDWLSLGYIDAFAGEGSIELATTVDDVVAPPLQGLIERQARGLIRGSVTRALELEPGFDGYVLIEKDKASARELEDLYAQHPDKNVQVRTGDANDILCSICENSDWSERRAVVFLDPPGMQVEWRTLKAIAETGAIDLWIWFPIGIGVNRLLPRSGDIPEEWESRLNVVFGTEDWKTHFFEKEAKTDLFGNMRKDVRKIATFESIRDYWNDRLGSIFPAVSDNAAMLRNSTNNPMYLLCFASANPGRGGQIAVRIADHILDNV
jgi:three-Cys-motif partner protein